MIILIGLVLLLGLLSIGVAVLLARWVLDNDRGTEAMQKISNALQTGAEAFLARQNKTIVSLSMVLATVIFILYGFVRPHHAFDPVDSPVKLAILTTISFLLGAGCSVLAGYIGMWTSIRANIRTASAARSSLNK